MRCDSDGRDTAANPDALADLQRGCDNQLDARDPDADADPGREPDGFRDTTADAGRPRSRLPASICKRGNDRRSADGDGLRRRGGRWESVR